MKRCLLLGCAALALAAGRAGGQDSKGPAQEPPKFPDFDKLVKGAKEHDGLFKLYHKEETVYAELKPQHLNKPYLIPTAVARGAGIGGFTLNFDEQWVVLFKRVSETKLHLIRRNVRYQARAGSPVAKAVETTYADSVLMAIPIRSVHPGRQTLLIDLNDIFMTDFAQLGIGMMDRNRSTWHKVKAFPRNVELQVAATFAPAGRAGAAFDGVIDSRGTTVVIHYGIVELPDAGYQPRLADDRVGHFVTALKDFSSDSKDTSFVRYVNRWRLEKADPKAKLSVPKKKIVFWIEKSVPYEYRAYVRDGILEWNKAFEKIGFRDAIEVRQQESEDFDPEDMNYNTFRWIATGMGFAMGPSRANPLTGEILDADIIFDADMVRYYKVQSKMLGTGVSLEEAPSAIRALRQGHGLPDLPVRPGGLSWDTRAVGAGSAPLTAEDERRARLLAVQQGLCQCGPCRKYELGLAALALGAREGGKPGEGLPEELVGQAIKETVMHEVGHTLGLRHNFKASTMLKNEQLHDVAVTRKQGLVGSVMDYNPVNLAPRGVKQGDYFSTTIGPYDYWAIEYAYKPLDGGTEGELPKLQEIARRGAAPGHDYGTDEDLFTTSDPLINQWDLGADPMKFAMDRMLLAEDVMKTLHEKVVDSGEGYQRLRMAFNLLLRQYGDGAFLMAQHVGGELTHRDHRGDPDGRDPFVPVQSARQRKALEFLKDHVLTDRYFKFPPQLLRRLAAERWLHWGNERELFTPVDVPVHQRILGIQRVVLDHLLNPAVLRRVQNNALKVDGGDQPLTIAEVMRTLTDGIWNEFPAKGSVDTKRVNGGGIIRRNLQREHLKDLSELVLGRAQGGAARATPADARSLARLHLREIQDRIAAALGDKGAAGLDETTRAHLEECRERITRVLTASLQLTDR